MVEKVTNFELPKSPVLSGPKRHHFLPRFYLHGFGRDGVLAVYDRESNEIRMQKPENTGVIGHFYTIEDDQGRKRFDIELLLSKIEAKAAPIIKRLAAKQNITADERDDLAIFVAMGMGRTPDFIDSIKQMKGNMIERMTKLVFSSVEQAKKTLRKMPNSPDSENELERQAQEVVEFANSDRYSIEVDHQWALGISLRILLTIAPILASRHWVIVHRDNRKQSFVTSDAPLVLTTVVPRESSFWGIGFGNEDALVLFPLTESCALLIFASGGHFTHKTISQTEVRRINLMVADRCQRFVLGRDPALIKSLVEHLNLGKKHWKPKMRAG